MEERGKLSEERGQRTEEELIEAVNQDDTLDEDQKRAVIAHISATQVNHFSGPLPHPDVLAGYARIQPDFPERIFAMAEREQAAQIAHSAVATKAEARGLTFVAISFALMPVASVGAMIVGAVMGVNAAIWAGLFTAIASAAPQVISKIRRTDQSSQLELEG